MEVRFVVWKKEIYYLNLGFVKSYLEISVHENKNSIFSLKYFYNIYIFFFTCCFFFKCCFMLEHLCVDLEQESKEALATWVLVQIYTQSSFLCLYVLAYFSL